MSYRIACIYVEEQSTLKEVKLEVCNDSTSTQIAPFMRKVTVSELAGDDNPLTRRFASLLNNLGFEYQPFTLSGTLLHDPELIGLVASNSFCFVQNGKNRSLKHGLISLQAGKRSLPTAKLLGGTLYVTKPSEWWLNIRVRLRYADALTELYPTYNTFPILTVQGGCALRNAAAEAGLLSTLLPCQVTDEGTISLSSSDVSFLKSLSESGWNVLYANGKSKASKLYFKQSKTGINWFTTDDLVDDEITDRMLSAYLQARNYQQDRFATRFFSYRDIESQQKASFLTICLDDPHLIEKYADEPITSEEKNRIRRAIEKDFKAQLHDYQWDGVFWLAAMRKKGCGCIIADEMGLGKTIQVLAHLHASGSRNSLIVVPTSLVSNWASEIHRFLPSWENKVSLNARIPETDKSVHVVSYELLRRNINHYKNQHFDSIVLDEAQLLKNDKTQRHKVISQIDFMHGIVMTGTPIENAVDDVWSYFFILMPGMRAVYDRLRRLSDGNTHTDTFLKVSSKVLSPFILRRTKKDYLKDLPPCIERNIYLTLGQDEFDTYMRVRKIFGKALKDGISGRVNSIALEALLRLRQTCVSRDLLPSSLYKGERRLSTKMAFALGVINNLGRDDKLIVFSQFVQALEEFGGYLAENGIQYVLLFGTTTDRHTPVDRFQNDANIRVFLSSIKAGGVGLNLTSADYVLLLDDWWNPAVEAQAFSRAHRIGQHRTVEVMRLICKDTVEEKILALQQRKQQTADVFNLGGNKLTIEELKSLLS